MSNHSEGPAPIQPVQDMGPRPFWSVAIPNYNSGAFLRPTLEAVLAQDPGAEQMEIFVSDNCSTTDDPEPVIRAVAGDRIRLHRQPRNLGVVGNFNSCIEQARGEWVHILCSDDIVLPGFYKTLRKGIEDNPEAGAAFSRFVLMDADGNWNRLSTIERRTPGFLEDWLDQIAVFQRIAASAIVVRRSVYEQMGGFRPDLIHALDWEMWKRIACRHPFWYEPTVLACFRFHHESDTARLRISGADVADGRRSIEITRQYLPPEKAERLTAQAKRNLAQSVLSKARALFNQGRHQATLHQMREAMRCDTSPATLWMAGRLVFWLAKRVVYKGLRTLAAPVTRLLLPKGANDGFAPVRAQNLPPPPAGMHKSTIQHVSIEGNRHCPAELKTP